MKIALTAAATGLKLVVTFALLLVAMAANLILFPVLRDSPLLYIAIFAPIGWGLLYCIFRLWTATLFRRPTRH